MNGYPLHIEKQQELLFKRVIDRLSRMALPKFKAKFEVKADEDDFGSMKNNLNDEFKKKLIATGYIAAEIEDVAKLLDDWSFTQTKKAILKLQKMKKKTAREILPVIFEKESPLVEHLINEYTKRNVMLVEALGKEYIPQVAELASKTFHEGGSMKELTKQLTQYTTESKNKAAFWARDQVGDCYSQFTEIRQTQAGFQSYFWRSAGDNHVRETHKALEGRVFTWKNGASTSGLLDKPGARNPGQDWGCRCAAEACIE